MKSRLLSTLGICRKAGKLVLGTDAVTEYAADGKLFLILLCEDLSPRSHKNMTIVAEKHCLAVCKAPITMDEIKHLVGKRSGIMGIADLGLANLVVKTAQACTPDK